MKFLQPTLEILQSGGSLVSNKKNLKFKDYMDMIIPWVPHVISKENLYQIIMNVDNYDPANVNRQINGRAKVPKKIVKKIVLEGKDKISKRLERSFSDSGQEFWMNIENAIINLQEEKTTCLEDYNTDKVSEKMAVLLLEALINTSCSWGKDDDDSKSDSLKYSQKCRDIFQFLKNENVNTIKRVSIMFHSGSNWYRDHTLDGRGALIKNLSQKSDVRILINDSENIQELFDTEYLRSEFGSYDRIHETVSGWRDMAKKYQFSVRSFNYIFFHSLCIVEYRNAKKKMYISNYVYKNGLAVEQHPKYVLTENDEDFKSYYNEYNYIWGKSSCIYEVGKTID